MIYNLAKYLQVQLPTQSFVVNGLQKNSGDDIVELSERGGIPNNYIDRDDYAVQLISRSYNKITARDQLQACYTLLHKKFGLVLPEETVATVTYPSIRTWKIVGTNIPTLVGSDENGKWLFSVNFIITTQ